MADAETDSPPYSEEPLTAGSRLLVSPSVMSLDDSAFDEFRAVVEAEIDWARYPNLDRVDEGVPIYEMAALNDRFDQRPTASSDLLSELAHALSDGPGIIVLAGGLDGQIVDRASDAFDRTIEAEKADAVEVGDHFAAAGANDRVWNALEKLAVAEPDIHVDYYSNEALALGALAWLGPAYAVTSQVNVVNPGGAAQVPHRDYHLGFMSDERAAQYPRHAHQVSPVLTLQGAVAHGDMPIETGPTMYLPGSHRYLHGYLAWRQPEFVEYFDQHHVQLPLSKGDVVFFNPAMFHGAGQNKTSDVRRMANLLQISSAMGIPLEAVDRRRMVLATFETMRARLDAGVDPILIGHAAAATAQGYAFSTNLDRDQPVGGLTPPSQLDLLVDALERRIPLAQFEVALEEHTNRRRTY